MVAEPSHHPIRAISINERLLQWFGKTGLTLLWHPARKPLELGMTSLRRWCLAA